MEALRLAEARFRLRPAQDTVQEVCVQAMHLIEDGFDAPSLRMLAGDEDGPDGEVRRLLDNALEELALEPLNIEECLGVAIEGLAQSLLDGTIVSTKAAVAIWQLYAHSDRSPAETRSFDRIAIAASNYLDEPDFFPLP